LPPTVDSTDFSVTKDVILRLRQAARYCRDLNALLPRVDYGVVGGLWDPTFLLIRSGMLDLIRTLFSPILQPRQGTNTLAASADSARTTNGQSRSGNGHDTQADRQEHSREEARSITGHQGVEQRTDRPSSEGQPGQVGTEGQGRQQSGSDAHNGGVESVELLDSTSYEELPLEPKQAQQTQQAQQAQPSQAQNGQRQPQQQASQELTQVAEQVAERLIPLDAFLELDFAGDVPSLHARAIWEPLPGEPPAAYALFETWLKDITIVGHRRLKQIVVKGHIITDGVLPETWCIPELIALMYYAFAWEERGKAWDVYDAIESEGIRHRLAKDLVKSHHIMGGKLFTKAGELIEEKIDEFSGKELLDALRTGSNLTQKALEIMGNVTMAPSLGGGMPGGGASGRSGTVLRARSAASDSLGAGGDRKGPTGLAGRAFASRGNPAANAGLTGAPGGVLGNPRAFNGSAPADGDPNSSGAVRSSGSLLMRALERQDTALELQGLVLKLLGPTTAVKSLDQLQEEAAQKAEELEQERVQAQAASLAAANQASNDVQDLRAAFANTPSLKQQPGVTHKGQTLKGPDADIDQALAQADALMRETRDLLGGSR
jgi:hypothetical protein